MVSNDKPFGAFSSDVTRSSLLTENHDIQVSRASFLAASYWKLVSCI